MPFHKTSREEIIKEAFKVFVRKGYYHTSISDLSKACGIEKPHFYYYFRSKKDIMIAVLDFSRQWAIENMFIYAYKKGLRPAERMTKLLNALKSIYLKGFTGCIFSNTALETANNDAAFTPLIKDYFGIWKEALIAIYLEKFEPTESEQRATRFFYELNGAILMMKLYRDISYLDCFIEYHTTEL